MGAWAMSVLAAVFFFGTFGFWIFMAVLVGILLYAMEEENGKLATCSVLATLVLLQLFGDIKAFTWLSDHPLQVLKYVGLYYLSGTAWSAVKWFLFVRERRERYDERRERFLKSKRVSDGVMPENLKHDWKELVEDNDLGKPEAMQNKSRILMWMTHWPWSLVWTLLDDVVKRIFRELYNAMQRVYRGISDWAYRGTEKDLPQD